MKITNCNIANNSFTGVKWHPVLDTEGVQYYETLLFRLNGEHFCVGYLGEDDKWHMSDEEGCCIKSINNVTHWARINNPQ